MKKLYLRKIFNEKHEGKSQNTLIVALANVLFSNIVIFKVYANKDMYVYHNSFIHESLIYPSWHFNILLFVVLLRNE